MRLKSLLAAVLIGLGVLVLAYSGITFTTPESQMEIFGLQFGTTRTHFIPPLAGAIALASGIVLLFVAPRHH
ncbi:MAG: DUF3185 domain-containing protein [Myxococcota bacterium]